jgi:hypothetical protein
VTRPDGPPPITATRIFLEPASFGLLKKLFKRSTSSLEIWARKTQLLYRTMSLGQYAVAKRDAAPLKSLEQLLLAVGRDLYA